MAAVIARYDSSVRVAVHGVPDRIIHAAPRARQLAMCGLDAAGKLIIFVVKEGLKMQNSETHHVNARFFVGDSCSVSEGSIVGMCIICHADGC